MFELKDAVPKTGRLVAAAPEAGISEERKQRRMMVIALGLLLVAFVFVLYRDRDFWFPDTEQAQAEDQFQPTAAVEPSAATAATSAVVAQPASSTHKGGMVAKHPGSFARAKSATSFSSAAANPPAPPVTAIRTVLPPLEVEVVAGDVHRAIHPGTNSVRVDLQPGSAAPPVAVPAAAFAGATDSTASVNRNAAERVQMSADTAEEVSRPVQLGYPLLARQMKVQGSVILQALIGRDGLIQDLHVLSGPPILASAAEEAVKQWHFKPHYQGIDTVETQARITVNFIISTN